MLVPGGIGDLLDPYNVFTTLNGVLALPSSASTSAPKLFTNDKWQNCLFYKYAINMADEGTAITNGDGATKLNLTAPILSNVTPPNRTSMAQPPARNSSTFPATGSGMRNGR